MLKATKAFEKFLTDFSANKKRLEKIDAAAAELEIIFPDRKKEVTELGNFLDFHVGLLQVAARQRETHKIYDGLVKLQVGNRQYVTTSSYTRYIAGDTGEEP